MRAPGYWWLPALILIVMAGVLLAGQLLFQPAEVGADGPAWSQTSTVQAAAARRETRPTLDPALFVGKARLAHQVAREIPDTLDRLYCYCECDKHMGHKSLLSCYTDGHAAT
jgi:hypothetical protein